MLPNYFYNNSYTIVQSKDAVMIMTEMVHDATPAARFPAATSIVFPPAVAVVVATHEPATFGSSAMTRPSVNS